MAPLKRDSLRGKAMGTAPAMMLIDEGADVCYARRADGMTALKFAVMDFLHKVNRSLIA